MSIFKKKEPDIDVLVRRHRYAVIALMDATQGNSLMVTNLSKAARGEWRMVNR